MRRARLMTATTTAAASLRSAKKKRGVSGGVSGALWPSGGVRGRATALSIATRQARPPVVSGLQKIQKCRRY